MPALPQFVTRFIKFATGEDNDRILIHKNIIKDPALCVSLINIANGKILGDGHTYTSIGPVVERFGANYLARMAFSLSLNSMIRSMPARRHFDPERVANTGIFVSFLAAGMAKRTSQYSTIIRPSDETFCISIARDIHVAMLSRVAPDIYDGIADFACIRKMDFRTGFETVLGSPMQDLAKGICRAWRLPSPFPQTAGCGDVSFRSILNSREAAILIMAEAIARTKSVCLENWKVEVSERPELRPLVGLSDWDLNELATEAEDETLRFVSSAQRIAA